VAESLSFGGIEFVRGDNSTVRLGDLHPGPVVLVFLRHLG